MIEIAVALLVRRGAVWTRRRSGTGHLDGFWEFPGGKLEPGESPLEALLREVREETSVALPEETPQPLLKQPFSYPERDLLLHFFLCRIDEARPSGGGCWTPVNRLRESDFPAANQAAIRLLKERVKRS